MMAAINPGDPATDAPAIFLGENADSIFLGSALERVHRTTSAPAETREGSKRKRGGGSAGAGHVIVPLVIPMHALEILGQAIADAGGTAGPSQALARLAPAEPEPTPDIMDTKQVAEYLGRSVSGIHKLTATGSIPFIQDGPRCRCYFRRSEIDTWLRDQRG